MRYFRIFFPLAVFILLSFWIQEVGIPTPSGRIMAYAVARCFLIIVYFYAGFKFILLVLRAEETVILLYHPYMTLSGTFKPHVDHFLYRVRALERERPRLKV